jgi:hypothetical protein
MKCFQRQNQQTGRLDRIVAKDMDAESTVRDKHRVIASVIIVAAAAFVYRAAVSAYFFDDDFQWLVGTWAFHPAHLLDFAHLTHFYRPVIDLYFAAATPLFGGSPMLFHLANIGLHGANGLLLFALARAISGNTAYAFLTALFFVVQPGDVDAIAWVSALAEAVAAFFGCLALLWFLQFRRGGRSVWHVLSVITFLFALLTHESSVMFLPLLVLADWAFAGANATAGVQTRPWTSRLCPYVPYGILVAAYLAIDLQINSRNYVVAEGHYRIGGHVVTNALDYIVTLYVGRRDIANYLMIATGLTVLLLRGSRRVVFATSWLILSLLPFVFFRWGNTGRYLYLPAMGFSMLVADGVMQLDRLLASRLPRAQRTAVLALVATAVAGRFTLFAAANVKSFTERTEAYRRYITLFKQTHGDLPSDTRIPFDPSLGGEERYRFLNALVQWEYRDPTIGLTTDRPNPR